MTVKLPLFLVRLWGITGLPNILEDIVLCVLIVERFHYHTAIDNHTRLHIEEKKYQCRHYDRRFWLFTICSRHTWKGSQGNQGISLHSVREMFMKKGLLRIHMKKYLNKRDHVCKVYLEDFYWASRWQKT